jgi:penicillin amidase
MSPDEPSPTDAGQSLDGTLRRPGSRTLRIFALVLLLLVIVAAAAFVFGRIYFTRAMRADLPQLDGVQVAYGLSAPVTVERDEHGVPHIHAQSMDDLIFAQGYITAQDRLWQMELLRRHTAGELAAVIGSSAVREDIAQRTLQLRAVADRTAAALPEDQKHWLAVYAAGVNASIIQQSSHLPVEFRLLRYKPAPWTPRDSILVELAIYQELTNTFPQKLVREALSTRLPPELITDLYPVGSWRDHPPGAPLPDVTSPRTDYKDVPLDDSQSQLRLPAAKIASSSERSGNLRALNQLLSLFGQRSCTECIAGSNGWAVAGARTASGKPMLSNDMHLSLQAPGVWYEADLSAPMPAPLAGFHAAGVTLPGVPFIIAGHNDHVAWGFTNLGADIQDIYIEHTRGTPSGAEYQTATGEWRPVKYAVETIHVLGGKDVVLNVPLTHHGDADTPIISSLSREARTLSLHWTIYDTASVSVAPFAVNAAADWPSMLAAFANWGGPPLNLMYADDQGHIGYHAVGRVPIRGDANNPAPLAAVPTDVSAPDAITHEWAGYIPFDQLPQALDPPDGVLATANSRVTLDGYRYPIALDWMAPYRTERIYKVLESSATRTTGPDTTNSATHLLTPADMLALQTDVYSDLDHLMAQRLAYAIDHANDSLKNDVALHQAADLLRQWNGRVEADAAAPAIVNAARNVFWQMLLIPRLVPQAATPLAQGADMSKLKLAPDQALAGNLAAQYKWGERGCVEEMLLTNMPPRWLPAGYANWNDFLATVVRRGLKNAKAPNDLSTWQQGKAFPVDIEHPLFASSALARALVGVQTGTGPQPHKGDGTTVQQMTTAFAPSERFTADLSNPDSTTLDVVLGESGNPASSWYMDQFPDWLAGRTYAFPFTPAATQPTVTHTLTLTPR